VKKIRHPPGYPVPAAYSHGVEVPASARVLYLAGQVGSDPAGKVASGIEAQTRQAFSNMQAVLRTADMTLDNVVKTTVYLIEPKDFAAFVKVRTEFLGANKPASTLVFIKQLAQPEFLVEVDAIAVAD
jgi:2-iminobutanoate/2-iminopropanoate deaminase